MRPAVAVFSLLLLALTWGYTDSSADLLAVPLPPLAGVHGDTSISVPLEPIMPANAIDLSVVQLEVNLSHQMAMASCLIDGDPQQLELPRRVAVTLTIPDCQLLFDSRSLGQVPGQVLYLIGDPPINTGPCEPTLATALQVAAFLEVSFSVDSGGLDCTIQDSGTSTMTSPLLKLTFDPAVGSEAASWGSLKSLAR